MKIDIITQVKTVISISAIIPIIIAFFIYMLGSFTAGTSNPSMWTEDSRGFAALIWVIIAFVADLLAIAMFLHVVENHNNDIDGEE